MGMLVPLADHLSAEGMEIVAVDSQGLTGARESQLIGQENLEEIHHYFPASQILRLHTPSVGPAIDIEIIFLEGRG
jgi:hypothetical protein